MYSTGFGTHTYSVVFRILMVNNTQRSDYGTSLCSLQTSGIARSLVWAGHLL